MVIGRPELKIGWAVAVCVLSMLIVAGAASANDAQQREAIGKFLDHYFSSWSAGDMAAYQKCFHPEATIVFLDRANARHVSYSLPHFIRTQEKAHQTAAKKMREIPLEKQITSLGPLGQATVRWKLFKGDKITTGVDLFTLVLTGGEWKILHLTVRND